MKKNAKIYVICLSVFAVLFTFGIVKAQNQRTSLKKAYEDFFGIDNYILSMSSVSSSENLSKAKTMMENIEKNFIEDPNIYFKKAQLLLQMKEYEEAEKCIEKIFEMRPDLESNTDILTVYANIVFLKGDHEKAQEITDKLNSLGAN